MPGRPPHTALLFRHVSAERAEIYRAIMDVFAAAKRQFRLQLRPEEVLAEGVWPGGERPTLESVQQALSQLVEWGNLHPRPDMTRVASLDDYYRARFFYRLTEEGEAVEAGMAAFAQALGRRAELQSVALEDILARLQALHRLALAAPLDAAKAHETLRDLLGVFTSLTENAQAFMAGIERTLDLQRADMDALMDYKQRLIGYLERFIGDLVARSGAIAGVLTELAGHTDAFLSAAAAREMRDAAPGGDHSEAGVLQEKLAAWQERWRGLSRWFVSHGHRPSEAELLRASARSAIPRLLSAIAAFQDRRSGKSDRSADFHVLALWFAECASDGDAHRLYRAAFALSPARHLALACPALDVPASRPWANAPPVQIHPKLRERGTLQPRGTPPKIRDRSQERALLAAQLAQEQAQLDAARAKLVRGEPLLLSELGLLDRHQFRLLLSLIGEAMAAQPRPDATVERQSGDGLLWLRLEPLGPDTCARIETEDGVLTGRDHRLTVSFSGTGMP